MTTSTKTQPIIRQLPANLVNQIAAGEVIERPASVVKELLENSVDAGSHRVELTIQGGGSELIRISDDGCGMSADQLPLAVTSHATSKLPDDEALFHVGTLGFRGEALASIGSVSQLTIRSRTEDDATGAELNVRGGVIDTVSPAGCPVGTVIEVKNLFFNTPVRHKFLKTAQTERGHISEAFTRIALANPSIHFVFRQGDRLVHDLPPTTRWADRISAFFGPEIAEALIPIHSDDAEIAIDGFVCDPSVSRGNNRMQYLFLNGRHIRDRSLQHALGESYRGMLMVGRQPVCFLRMTLPAEMVDVNVHPAKLEVRFTDSGRVYGRLLQTLRHHFLTTNLTQSVGPPSPSPSGAEMRSMPETVMGMSAKAVDSQRQAVINWAKTGQDTTPDQGDGVSNSVAAASGMPSAGIPSFQPFPTSNIASSFGAGDPAQAAGLDQSTSVDRQVADLGVSNRSGSDNDVAPWDQADAETSSTPGDQPRETPQANSPTVCHLGFQVHNRYLVTQNETGMVIIDQHALHERVLYERVCEKVLTDSGKLESQRLLVPEPVTVTPSEHSAAMQVKDTLARIGLEIEDFGGDTILIHSYPAMLPSQPPGEMLHVILESLMGAGKQPDAKDLLNHLLSTIACKAAVKAGDPLSKEEIESLLEQRDLYHETHHCPHGRPTALFFSIDELDRMFGRLGPRSRA